MHNLRARFIASGCLDSSLFPRSSRVPAGIRQFHRETVGTSKQRAKKRSRRSTRLPPMIHAPAKLYSPLCLARGVIDLFTGSAYRRRRPGNTLLIRSCFHFPSAARRERQRNCAPPLIAGTITTSSMRALRCQIAAIPGTTPRASLPRRPNRIS